MINNDSVKDLSLIDITKLNEIINEIRWTNPSGLLWKKCPQCGGRIKITKLKNEKIEGSCSKCGKFYF